MLGMCRVSDTKQIALMYVGGTFIKQDSSCKRATPSTDRLLVIT